MNAANWTSLGSFGFWSSWTFKKTRFYDIWKFIVIDRCQIATGFQIYNQPKIWNSKSLIFVWLNFRFSMTFFYIDGMERWRGGTIFAKTKKIALLIYKKVGGILSSSFRHHDFFEVQHSLATPCAILKTQPIKWCPEKTKITRANRFEKK